MPVVEPYQIFVNNAFWFRIPDIYQNGVLLTDSNAPDSFTYTIYDQDRNEIISDGVMVHSDTTPGTWEAEIRAPEDPGVYFITAEAINDGEADQDWVDTFPVRR